MAELEVKAPVTQETVPDTPSPSADIVVNDSDAPETGTGLENETDAQLKEKIQAGFKGKAPEPPPEPDKDVKDKADVKPEEVKEEKKEEKPPEKLFADKYKTEADLKKGILELAKFLKLPESVVATAVDKAEETKDWGLVEKMYKAMESEKGKVRTAAPAPVPAKAEATTVGDQELLKTVGEATFDHMLSDPIVLQMRAEGLAMPRTQDELTELWKSNPRLAYQFQEAFKTRFQDFLKEAQEFQKASGEVESVNKQLTESETTAIREFCTKNGIVLSDQDVADLITESQGSPLVYEDRHGVQFMKEKGLFKYFMAERFPNRMEEFMLSTKAQARKEAIEDQAKLKGQALQTISTAGGGQTRQTEEPKIDLNNEKEVEKLGDKKLKDTIRGILFGQKT